MTNRKCKTHVFVSNILFSPEANVFLACRTRCMIGNIKMLMIAIQFLTFEGERLLENMLSHHGMPNRPENQPGAKETLRAIGRRCCRSQPFVFIICLPTIACQPSFHESRQALQNAPSPAIVRKKQWSRARMQRIST